MRRSIKKIFRRHPDGTEHEYEEEEDDNGSPRYSAENRRSMGDRPSGRSSIDHDPRRDTKHVEARLSGLHPSAASDDDLVNNVLYQTRGQETPAVPGLGHSGNGVSSGPTIRTVNDDDPRSSQDRLGGSAAGFVQKKPVVPRKSDRRSVDEVRTEDPNFYANANPAGRQPIDEERLAQNEDPNYYSSSMMSDSPVSSASNHASADGTNRRRSIDQGPPSRVPPSPTAAFYGVPDRKPVPDRRSIERAPITSGGVLKSTPPRSSSLRNSMDATAMNLPYGVGTGSVHEGHPSLQSNGGSLASAGREPNGSKLPVAPTTGVKSRSALATDGSKLPAGLERESNGSKLPIGLASSGRDATASHPPIDKNRDTVLASVKDTGFNAPHGLFSEKGSGSSNVATLPNMASSTKMEKSPALATSPDVQASTSGSTIHTTPLKPNGTAAGWPLVEHRSDPATTVQRTGQQTNVADGPIAAAFAAKYSEPDKFSSHLHIHKDEKVAKPVVHEKIQRRVHHIVTEEIERHVHTHEIRVHIQHLKDRVRLPDKHWVQQADGSLTEISPQMVDILKSHPGYREVERFEEVIDHRGKSNLDPHKIGGHKAIGHSLSL